MGLLFAARWAQLLVEVMTYAAQPQRLYSINPHSILTSSVEDTIPTGPPSWVTPTGPEKIVTGVNIHAHAQLTTPERALMKVLQAVTALTPLSSLPTP